MTEGLLETVFKDLTSSNDRDYKVLWCKRCGQPNEIDKRVDTINPVRRHGYNSLESYCIKCWWREVNEH